MEKPEVNPQAAYPALWILWFLSLVSFPLVFKFNIGLEYTLYAWKGLLSISMLATLMLMVFGWLWARKNKKLRIILAFIITPTLFPWVYYGIYQLNVRPDTSAVEYHVQKILDKQESGGGYRQQKTYTLYVIDWIEPKQIFYLNSDAIFYNDSRTLKGNHIRFATHKGYLGYEWIEKYEVVEGTDTDNTP